MKRKDSCDPSVNPTQELHIQVPCRLVERIETYARLNQTSTESVVIEALDTFLRGQGTTRQ